MSCVHELALAPDKTPKIDFIGKIQRISGQNLVDRTGSEPPGLFQIRNPVPI